MLAAFIRESFYPTVLTASDVSFVTEQGILPASGPVYAKEILFRLIDKKSAFEWQQGVLTSWDGTTMKLLVNGQPRQFQLSPDAPIYQRVGDERLAMRQGSWIGGELMDFRAVGDTIQMLVYRINFANPAADRYSRLALWQVHKTRQELDTAFKPLNIGGFQNMRVLARGPSERPVTDRDRRLDRTGHSSRAAAADAAGFCATACSPSISSGTLKAKSSESCSTAAAGATVSGCVRSVHTAWRFDGATYEQILKKYYKGIDLKKL